MTKEYKKIEEKLDIIISLLSQGGHKKNLNPMGSKEKKQTNNSYAGITGGIDFILNQGFFDKGRSLKEILEELKTNTYHYPRTSVQPALIKASRPGGILVRFKEEGLYMYAKRK